MTEVTPPAPDGHRAPNISFEFLPAQDRGDGEESVGDHQASQPACAQFRLGDLWRRRLDRERTHATIARILAETDLVPAAHLTCVGAASGEIDDIRRPLSRYRRPPTSSRCAAIRRAASAPPTPRIRMATRLRPNSSPASRSVIPTSRFPSPPIRRSIRKARTSTPTSMC